jgi:hypothetical protein
MAGSPYGLAPEKTQPSICCIAAFDLALFTEV